MFVQAGAKERIMEARKESFYDTYITKLINEAKLIGISKAELIKMIDENK